jgi:hypothetical protein
MTETVFSFIIRMFGREYVSARRYPNMVKENTPKASSLYNMFISVK